MSEALIFFSSCHSLILTLYWRSLINSASQQVQVFGGSSAHIPSLKSMTDSHTFHNALQSSIFLKIERFEPLSNILPVLLAVTMTTLLTLVRHMRMPMSLRKQGHWS